MSMRFKNKPFVVFLFVFIFAILIIVSLGNAGILRHTVMSPFETLVAEDEQTYTSTETTVASETVVANIYKHFDEYESDDILEPFCRIGGQYTVDVYNDASPATMGRDDKIPIVLDINMKAFYCKTTFDLLERVKIPAAWEDDNLLVYCNDGGNIISNSTNYDFIISQMNTYKACVVRNLDLDDQNTLIFGFDVGNKVVDSYPEYFFNRSTMKGPVLPNLEYIRDISSTTGSSTAYMGQYRVPYEEITVATEQEWVPMSDAEAKDYMIEEFELSDDIEISLEGNYPEIVSGDATADSYSVYSVRGPYSYEIRGYEFNYTKTNMLYYFGYDFNDGFYYMKDFAADLDVEILDVFTDAEDIIFPLSRVALFKKIDNKFIYGYEEVSNNVISEEPYNISVKPVYKIQLENFGGFGQQKCMDSLMKYQPMNNAFQGNTGVSCDGNVISIVALNVDKNQNDVKYSFHLFKNIVTSLK